METKTFECGQCGKQFEAWDRYEDWGFGEYATYEETDFCSEECRDEWVPVDGFENMPSGEWQVFSDGSMPSGKIQSASKKDTYGTVGSIFHWNAPKVTHYKPLPKPPQS